MAISAKPVNSTSADLTQQAIATTRTLILISHKSPPTNKNDWQKVKTISSTFFL
jgi:hypothetical protein